MGKTVGYQGYTIQSAPRLMADGGKWGLHIIISVEHPHAVKMREFSAEVLYASEHEADIHGIAFGQRLIDGKVDGRSVVDLKMPDRRATPRFRVQFRATFSGPTKLEGTGIMLDLSTGGCRVESPVPLAPGVTLELRIYVPDQEWPLMVEGASVQWISGQVCGLAFFQMRDSERQRLGQVITTLMDGGGDLAP